MASQGKDMIRDSPPDWLRRTLWAVLSSRDRETIAGDLLEEYREEQLPRSGSVRANYWYLRQVMSFIPIRLSGGQAVKQILLVVSIIVAAAGVWLGVMENILKHAGFAGRSVVASCIVAQAFATLFFILVNRSAPFRAAVLAGAMAIGLLGGFSILRIMQAQHFEGFVLLIGSLLVMQCGLTLAVILRKNHAHLG